MELIWSWIWHILVFIAVLLFCAHLWFINNSEAALEETIRAGSNGKLNCTVKRFSLNYFTNVINVDDFSIFNTDSTAQATSYKVDVHHFHLRIRSKWDLIFHSRLLIDSVVFIDPKIQITRAANRISKEGPKRILLVQELGKVYQTINNSLQVLNLDVFEIQEGKLSVIEAGHPEKEPLNINHIYFRVNKLLINAENLLDKSRFHFSESILLRVADQNILLPDKHSRLAFKELLIDTKQKMLRLAAPKLNLLPAEDQKNTLNFEAKSVNILGLDFNSLYLHDLLKIDSFILESPIVDLDLYRKTKTKSAAARRIEIDSFINRLPMAINIRHLLMRKEELTIKLHKSGKTTTFSTKNDDIAIADFHLNDHSDQGIRITGFKYTIRHYVGFSADSTYRFDFDSLQFINNKIILYNLQVNTVKKTKITLLRNYSIPRFEITEMDWFSFILENHLIAKEAVMYDPVLNLEKNLNADPDPGEPAKKKKSVYEFLSLFDKIIVLEQLQIFNGTFNYQQSNNLNAHIQQLNLNICLKDLGKVRTPEELFHTFQNLSFDTATVHNAVNFLTIHHSVLDVKKQKIGIEDLHFEAEMNNIAMSLKGVEIQDFLIDSNILDLSSIAWRSGIIHLNDPQKSTEKVKPNRNAASIVSVSNIRGNNTVVHFDNEKLRASVYFDLISADHFSKENGKPFQLDSFWLEGNKIRLHLQNGDLRGGAFVLRDQMPSFFENLVFSQKNNNDSLFLAIPLLKFIPDIKQTAQKEAIILKAVQVVEPKLSFSACKKTVEPGDGSMPFFLPPLEFDGFQVEKASISILKHPLRFQCNPCSLEARAWRVGNDSMLFSKALTVNAQDLVFHLNDSLQLNLPGNTRLKTDSLSFFTNTRKSQMWGPKWQSDSLNLALARLNNPQQIAFRGIQATINQAVHADKIPEFLPWLINQSKANIRVQALHWQKNNVNLQIRQLLFNQAEKHLSLDSFSFDPGKPRAEFLKDIEYKKDYFQFSLGKTTLRNWSLSEQHWLIPQMETSHASVDIFVDKVNKIKSEQVKPMPAALIRKIPWPFLVDTLQLNNAKVVYSEFSQISKDTGTIWFSNIFGPCYHVQSLPGAPADSLCIAVRAKFLDQFPLKLDLRESIHDSLGGMELALHIGKGNLEQLNTFLPRLTGVAIQSGMLDSFQMRVRANDFSASGNTELDYHNLKAKIETGHARQRSGLKQRAIHFFINHIAIHRNMTRGNVQFDLARVRAKSPISFFLKMITTGALKIISPLMERMYRKHRVKLVHAVS